MHMADEPCERVEPERPAQPGRRRSTAAQWWNRLRPGLALVEILAVARQNDALACGARAIALLGDTVFRSGQDD